MLLKRTIVMSSPNKKSEKAVLTIEKKNGEFIGSMRLYNFKSTPSGILTLAFLNNRKHVNKVGLNTVSKDFYSFKTESDLNYDSFTVALVNTFSGESTILVAGSIGKSHLAKNEICTNAFDILDEQSPTVEKIEKRLDEEGVEYDDELKEEIEFDIQKNIPSKECRCEKECTTCKYRQAFYEEDKKEFFDTIPPTSFYQEIKEQIDELFDKYEPETTLEKIIPSSKWVRVDYEENGQYYVVGLIYNNKELEYVCYGIPGIFSENAPKELGDFTKWLPIDELKPYELGYWISYQDAKNGDNVDVEVV